MVYNRNCYIVVYSFDTIYCKYIPYSVYSFIRANLIRTLWLNFHPKLEQTEAEKKLYMHGVSQNSTFHLIRNLIIAT